MERFEEARGTIFAATLLFGYMMFLPALAQVSYLIAGTIILISLSLSLSDMRQSERERECVRERKLEKER